MHHGWQKDVCHRARLGTSKWPVDNACNLIKLFAVSQLSTNDLRVLSEALRPVVVGENGIGMRTRGSIIAFRQQSTQSGLEAERLEHRAGDVLDIRLLHIL